MTNAAPVPNVSRTLTTSAATIPPAMSGPSHELSRKIELSSHCPPPPRLLATSMHASVAIRSG